MHYWKELWAISKQSNGFDRIRVFLKPPGWQPEYLGGFQTPQEINRQTYRKFDVDSLSQKHIYTFFVFLTLLSISTALLFAADQLSGLALAGASIYILATLVSFGGLMEKKVWIIPAEYTRIMGGLIIALLFWETSYFTEILQYSALFSLINLVWFSRVVKYIRKIPNVQLA